MDNFDKNFTRMRNFMLLALVAKLAVFGGLVWLAIYAINAFSQ